MKNRLNYSPFLHPQCVTRFYSVIEAEHGRTSEMKLFTKQHKEKSYEIKRISFFKKKSLE